MIVGVIGSGAIGPDLAYGFTSALASVPGARVYLLDIKQEALDAGVARIRGYMAKGVSRGKVSAKAAKAMEAILTPTLDMADLKDCAYVLEAATEQLPIKRAILRNLEKTVSDDCLIGFATSGLPRARIAAEATRPERCFVNHPFFPAWRSLPIEVVSGEGSPFEARMFDTLRRLGKVPVATADVPCFAMDDIFCNYCAEAARIVAEGVATPAQVDAIVNAAIGGGGPLNVLDGTRGNLLVVHCQELMEEATTGTPWFKPPAILTEKGNDAWHDGSYSPDPSHDDALRETVLNRMLAVLFARTFFVADNDICALTELDWMNRMALGFRQGFLHLASEMGMDRVHEICAEYAKANPGFVIPRSIAERRAPDFLRNVTTEVDGSVGIVRVFRPEVKNALNRRTLKELREAVQRFGARADITGVILSSFDGSLAGADLGELSRIDKPEDAVAICQLGHSVFAAIESAGKPVVAAVDGPVMGGGAEMSIACHARVVGTRLVLAQPEVNLGIIPGYGGTQRLPRLIGLEHALDLVRTGRAVGAAEASKWGWATIDPVRGDVVEAAKALIKQHLAGAVKLAPVDPAPMELPESLPTVALGHHSRAIDGILVDVVRRGLTRPLAEGLALEAEGFGRCTRTVDMDIGMKNFTQNGPRVPAVFLHE
ncbi:MAG: 3-hydroxyacyl-CoA dehydrogenase/enoyl-CoA hydratase family protein [Myxococcales bacterium]|nr:3-hydroxyacyl-CoA dehydrogenase/enoyl-CoA hydratase family protein [Myxococcales bacterium]MCB9756248.1 3-hydroxyacyl-CoA dehydrogenase/enoyl-CoA hydratase family protein [Myxococcales bacterium]